FLFKAEDGIRARNVTGVQTCALPISEHLEACNNLGLKGRILVSKDGINGTVSGPVSQTDAYIEMMRKDKRFRDMVFKTDEHDGHAFKKMHVRPRQELVT